MDVEDVDTVVADVNIGEDNELPGAPTDLVEGPGAVGTTHSDLRGSTLHVSSNHSNAPERVPERSNPDGSPLQGAVEVAAPAPNAWKQFPFE